MKFNFNNVETAVKNAPHNVFWHGWDIVIFDNRVNGSTRKEGMFHNGKWGIKTVISPNFNGEWEVPRRYERLFKRVKPRS